MLRGLHRLRQRGPKARPAVEAILEVPEVSQLRTGWELFNLLTEDADLNPEAFVREVVSSRMLKLAQFALWGEGHGGELSCWVIPRVILAVAERG